MSVLINLFPNLFDILTIAGLFFLKGGWVLVVWALVYILWRLYKVEIMEQYIHNIEWVFLGIKVPKENMVSTLAVENIFAQLHAAHTGKTFAQLYIEGHVQLWYSLEIISMGGKVSFVIKAPKRLKHVVEAAFYAQYPQAEISEVSDYMENIHYDPETSNFDVFGTEWKLNDDQVIPIKTYKDFEHPTAEEKIIDPLGPIFEGLAQIEPHEFFGIQIIIQPLADNEWKPMAERKVMELTGEEPPHTTGFADALMAPFNWFAKFSYTKAVIPQHDKHESENKPKNNWMSMTEFQKQRVNLVEAKISKPGYKTKIRFLYIAPKDRFDASKRSIFTGAYRPLGSVMTNKIRPDVGRTWTTADYLFSPGLEKPYLDYVLKRKKRLMFKGYKGRDWHIGLPMFIMNTEELATLYHFPITTKTTFAPSAVEKTETRKSQPPANLPIAEAEI